IEIPIFVRTLSKKERKALEAGLRSSDAFVLRRCQILLASSRGEHPPRIAENLGCGSQTVRNAIHAQLFHNGYPQQKNLDSIEGRAQLKDSELPAAARQVVDLSLAMIDHINEELEPIEEQLRSYARAQGGCKALMEHYGVGELTSVALLSELGDTRRFSSSKKAVRYAGMDVTV